MDIYLPIAGQSVNALLIIALGGLVGILSGMFGVGGGFLTTPLLIFYGIPPTVAVASATTQITGASVTGAMAHMRRGGADLQMGAVMVVGGMFGSLAGAAIFRALQASGQIDVVIGSLYVVLLGYIGILMLKDALIALGYCESQAARAAAAPQSLGRLASAALALLQVGPLHLAAGAARARLRRRRADHAARHRRRLHPRSGDDLSARNAGARRDRDVARDHPRHQRGNDDGPRADDPLGRYRARRPAADRRRRSARNMARSWRRG